MTVNINESRTSRVGKSLTPSVRVLLNQNSRKLQGEYFFINFLVINPKFPENPKILHFPLKFARGIKIPEIPDFSGYWKLFQYWHQRSNNRTEFN